MRTTTTRTIARLALPAALALGMTACTVDADDDDAADTTVVEDDDADGTDTTVVEDEGTDVTVEDEGATDDAGTTEDSGETTETEG